jgi:hypothetical protein
MGTEITQDVLNKINNKNSSIKCDQNINSIKTFQNNKNENISDIIKNIYYPIYKKEFSNKLTQNINLIPNNENIIIENNHKESETEQAIICKEKNNEEEEINNIIFRNHKSFDLSKNYFEEDFFSNLYKSDEYKNEEINSNKDNESNNSDYIDISEKILSFNKNKINENKLDKKLMLSKQIRNSYYHKLITKNQWNPLKKDKIFNNIFIFDWDDTLLCTSYLIPTGALTNMEVNRKDKGIISNLDSLASQLLSKTVDIGFVFIITNGAPGWVELSSVKFYPKTAEVLKKTKIISARGLCEKKLPGDVRQWKTMAFKYAIDSVDLQKNIPTNILCFGDSIIEMEASYNIKEYFSNAYLKTIKFKESPTHLELEKELRIISAQLDSILSNIKNLSIKVTKKKIE